MIQTLKQIIDDLDERIVQLRKERDEIWDQRKRNRYEADKIIRQAREQSEQLRRKTEDKASAAQHRLEKMQYARDTLCSLLNEQTREQEQS